MRKSWGLIVDGALHTVELDHGYWSGKRRVTVDGVEVVRTQRFMDSGSVHLLDVAGQPYELTISVKGIKFSYDLNPVDPADVMAASGVATEAAHEADLRAMKSGAGWFHWIAGLSVVNAGLALFNQSLTFVFGLELTTFAVALAAVTGDRVIALFAAAFGALLVGGFYVLGNLAAKGRGWAFAAGLVVYGLDALLYAWVIGEAQWLPLAIRAFVFYSVLAGLRARNRLTRAGAFDPGVQVQPRAAS
jgi:hypothetical protein